MRLLLRSIFASLLLLGLNSLLSAELPPAPGCQAVTASRTPFVPTETSLRGKAEPIRTLSITIVTSNDWFAGTDNEVWFDIGPMAWKLDGDFPRGSTRTIQLDVSRPPTDPLYVDDIVEVRLEKKGIHGWTDAPDSYIDPLLPSTKISPSDLVAVYQKQVEVARYGANQAASALTAVNHVIDEQDKAIAAANQVLNQAEDAIKTIPGTIANLNNRIVDTQVHLANTAQHIIGKVPIVGICIKKVGFLRVPYPCIQTIDETIVNSAFTALTNTLADLTKQKNDLEARLARAGIDKQQAAQKLIVAEGIKTDGLTRRTAAEAAALSANSALDVAQKGLQEAQRLASALPAIGIDVPHPNQWKPKQLTVTVNGRVFGTYNIDERLKAGHSSWVRLVRPMTPGEQFVRTLRAFPNGASAHSAEYIAGASTVFKNLGISGWKPGPVSHATVDGRLIHQPSCGSDGYVSLDLEVSKVTVGRKFIGLLPNSIAVNTNDVPHPRFIRIEYLRIDRRGHADERYTRWRVGDKFEVSGPVEWDTDKSGFFELHPVGEKAVRLVN